MAGFGSISLAQTVVGTLIDQRAVVLYEQPEIVSSKRTWVDNLVKELYGNQFKYQELFAGKISQLNADVLSKVVNVMGANPYGITYMSADVSVESDLCDHPVETGMVITDASIIRPVSARVAVAMPTFFAEKIYNDIYKLQQKKEKKIILQTKYGVYENLVLQNFSYGLDSTNIDRTIFSLDLRQVLEVEPYGEFKFLASKAESIKDASDANTISNGTQVAE